MKSKENLTGITGLSEAKVDMICEAVAKIRGYNDGFSPSSEQLKIYHSLFEEKGKLGKGGFGNVYLCKNKSDRNFYAVKRISCTDEKLDECLMEAEMMATLNHPNVIRYHLSWVEDAVVFFEESDGGTESSTKSTGGTESKSTYTKTLCIAMEYCPKTLDEVLKKDKLNPNDSLRYFYQLVDGLYYIHNKGIIHRDLSRQNIFIDADDKIKIADFGLGMKSLTDMETVTPCLSPVGNQMYWAPELKINPGEITTKADVYSLGLILFEMMNHMTTGAERIKTFDQIKSGMLDLNSMEGSQYLTSLLENDPAQRISSKELWILKGDSLTCS